VKSVHLVGFIIKKFVTMQHGHMNVKNMQYVTILFLKDSRLVRKPTNQMNNVLTNQSTTQTK